MCRPEQNCILLLKNSTLHLYVRFFFLQMLFCVTLKCTQKFQLLYLITTNTQQTQFDCLVLKERLQIPPKISPIDCWRDGCHKLTALATVFALTIAKRSPSAEWTGKCWDVTLLLSDSLVHPGQTGWVTYNIWQVVSQQDAAAEGLNYNVVFTMVKYNVLYLCQCSSCRKEFWM